MNYLPFPFIQSFKHVEIIKSGLYNDNKKRMPYLKKLHFYILDFFGEYTNYLAQISYYFSKQSWQKRFLAFWQFGSDKFDSLIKVDD